MTRHSLSLNVTQYAHLIFCSSDISHRKKGTMHRLKVREPYTNTPHMTDPQQHNWCQIHWFNKHSNDTTQHTTFFEFHTAQVMDTLYNKQLGATTLSKHDTKIIITSNDWIYLSSNQQNQWQKHKLFFFLWKGGHRRNRNGDYNLMSRLYFDINDLHWPTTNNAWVTSPVNWVTTDYRKHEMRWPSTKKAKWFNIWYIWRWHKLQTNSVAFISTTLRRQMITRTHRLPTIYERSGSNNGIKTR